MIKCHSRYKSESGIAVFYAHGISVGRDSSIGIATPHGLHGLGIESRWGQIFRTRPEQPCGPSSLPYNGHRVSFPG